MASRTPPSGENVLQRIRHLRTGLAATREAISNTYGAPQSLPVVQDVSEAPEEARLLPWIMERNPSLDLTLSTDDGGSGRSVRMPWQAQKVIFHYHGKPAAEGGAVVL